MWCTSNGIRILIASFLVVAVVFLATLAVCMVDAIGKDYGSVTVSFIVAAVVSIVAMVVTVVWAIPMHLLLAKFNLKSPMWYVLLALIPSLIFIYGFKPFGNDSPPTLAIQATFCFFVGAIGSIIFWYQVVYKQRITRVST